MSKALERLQYILLQYREEIRENYPDYFETVDALLAGINNHFLEWAMYMVQPRTDLAFTKISEVLDGLEQKKWINQKEKGIIWNALLQSHLGFVSTKPYSCVSFKAFFDYNSMDLEEKQEYLHLGQDYYQFVVQEKKMDVYDLFAEYMFFSNNKFNHGIHRVQAKRFIKRTVGNIENYVQMSEINRQYFEEENNWIAQMMQKLNLRSISHMTKELSLQGVSASSIESIRGYYERKLGRESRKKEATKVLSTFQPNVSKKIESPRYSEKGKKYAYHRMKEILNKVSANSEHKELIPTISLEDYFTFLQYASMLGPLGPIKEDIILLSRSLIIDESCYSFLINKAQYLNMPHEIINEILANLRVLHTNLEHCTDEQQSLKFEKDLQNSYLKLHLILAKNCDYECRIFQKQERN